MGNLFHELKRLKVFRISVAIAAVVWLLNPNMAISAEEFTAAVSIEELESRLNTVLEETEVPGLIGTIVYGDEIIWLGSLGLANTETGEPVTRNTLFRVGSISKSFTSLAILKLVERGQLSLDDLVRDVAPEAEVENRWEETSPITLAHVLEHTAGFDDIHFRDFSLHDPSISTLDGILNNNGSSTARWRPGTRMSYSNIGPPIAAVALEKVTGQTIEEFIDEEIFSPLGMRTATYFQNENVAASYLRDGSPAPYVSITMRSSGALNATSTDMAQALKMFNGRGRVGDVQIIRQASLSRMETPTSTVAVEKGLPVGYGLSNYFTQRNGFVFHGHNGGIDGFSSTFVYLPAASRAYFFSMNKPNGQAYQRISQELTGFITRDLTPPEPPAAIALTENELDQYTGIYEMDSPRQKLQAGYQRLLFTRISRNDSNLQVQPFGGSPVEIYPVSSDLFAREGNALPSSTFAESPDGEFLFISQGQATYKRIGPLKAYGRLAAVVYGVLMAASLILFSLIWATWKLVFKNRQVPHMMVRVMPAIAVLLLTVFVLTVVILLSSSDIASVNISTVGLWLSSMLFPVAAFVALGIVVANFKLRQEVGAITWHFCLHSSLGLVVLAMFVLSWGYFGIQTWTY